MFDNLQNESYNCYLADCSKMRSRLTVAGVIVVIVVIAVAGAADAVIDIVIAVVVAT